MTRQQSSRETLIEARQNKIESSLEIVAENQIRFDRKLDRLSEEIAETNKAIRQTNTAVDQTNTAVRMLVTAILAKEDNPAWNTVPQRRDRSRSPPARMLAGFWVPTMLGSKAARWTMALQSSISPAPSSIRLESRSSNPPSDLIGGEAAVRQGFDHQVVEFLQAGGRLEFSGVFIGHQQR